MPSTRFHPLHPRNSLRKLRTAFSSSHPRHIPQQQSPLDSSSFTLTSPLSARTTGSRLSGFSFGNMSALSLGSPASYSPARRLLIRRKKSTVQLEQEEERSFVGEDLLALVEPRPRVGAAYGGIEEVLEGCV